MDVTHINLIRILLSLLNYLFHSVKLKTRRFDFKQVEVFNIIRGKIMYINLTIMIKI